MSNGTITLSCGCTANSRTGVKITLCQECTKIVRDANRALGLDDDDFGDATSQK